MRLRTSSTCAAGRRSWGWRARRCTSRKPRDWSTSSQCSLWNRTQRSCRCTARRPPSASWTWSFPRAASTSWCRIRCPWSSRRSTFRSRHFPTAW